MNEAMRTADLSFIEAMGRAVMSRNADAAEQFLQPVAAAGSRLLSGEGRG